VTFACKSQFFGRIMTLLEARAYVAQAIHGLLPSFYDLQNASKFNPEKEKTSFTV